MPATLALEALPSGRVPQTEGAEDGGRSVDYQSLPPPQEVMASVGQTPEVASKSFFKNRYLSATKKQEIHEQFAIDHRTLKGTTFQISERTAKQAARSGSKRGTFHSFQSCATTNVTSNLSKILLDSGFSGLLVIGEETLSEHYKEDILKEKTMLSSVAPNIIFGAGKPQKCLKVTTLRNIGDCLVVAGTLGLIAGREWLKKKRAIMDFGENTVKLQGISGVSTPSHELQPSFLRASGSQVETDNDKQAAAVASIPGQGARCSAAGHAEDCCDELRYGYNLFTITTGSTTGGEIDDRQIEEAVLDGWMSEVTRSEATTNPVEVERGKALKQSDLNQRVLGRRDAEELEQLGGNRNKIFNITVSQLRKLHLLRHSPCEQIMKFLYECVPKFLSTHPLVLKFFRNCREWLNTIIAACVGCSLNGSRTAIQRAIPSLCPAFHIAMLDICVLDSSKELCCIVIVDLGSGIPAVQIIETQPPNSQSAFIAYVVGWASQRGAHRELITDRDGLFRAFNFLRLIEQLGAKKATTGAGSHESLAQAERLIRTIRWTIDRHRDNASDSVKPQNIADWRFFLAVLMNCLRNEPQGASQSTASLREYGRSTHLLRTALTDTPASAPEEYSQSSNIFPHLLQLAESARQSWRAAACDTRLRRLLADFKVPSVVQEPVFPPGTAVSFFRERAGSRNVSSRCGPAVVLGFDETSQRYLLDWGSNAVYSDRSFVARWTPAVETHMAQDHILGLIDPPAPKHLQNYEFSKDCGKCRNPSSHHAHTRKGDCRLNPENLRKTLDVDPTVTDDEREREQNVPALENVCLAAETHLADLQYEEEDEIDLENERFEKFVKFSDEFCYTIDESKYIVKWEDLSDEEHQKARSKAIQAYDENDAWDRSTDKSDSEFKMYLAKCKKENKTIIKLDARWVDVAKVKENGEVIGKSRLTPRGFDDRSWEATFYSGSPTVSSSSIRSSETLGLRKRLKGVLIDFSDAFFLGGYLNFPDQREIWLKVEELGISNWRRLKKEVPGCKGAAISWFRRIGEFLADQGYRMSSLDKCWFMKHSPSGDLIGSVPLHVDDCKCRFSEDELASLQAALSDAGIKVGTLVMCAGRSVEFCGITYRESDNGVEYDQDVYIQNKLTVPEKLKKGSENIEIENDGDYFLSTSDLAVYATNIGRLIWVLPTQLRSSYEISQLARRRTCARASDYNRLRTLILSIRLNPQRMTISRLSDQLGIKVIAVVDAGGSEKVKAPLKPRDQQCIMVLLAEAVPPGAASTAVVVYFASNGISRICHSSFDMEAVAGVSALDVSLNIRRGVGEFLSGVCPSFRDKEERARWENSLPNLELHSDAMSFVKVVRSGTSHVLARRRASDVEDVRQCMARRELSLILHIRGPTNPVDVGTKPLLKCQESCKILDALVKSGKYAPDMEHVSSYLNADENMWINVMKFSEKHDLSYLDLA